MKPHTLFVMSGTLTPDLQETWTCTMRLLGGALGAATAPIPEGDLQAYLLEVSDDIVAWFSNSLTSIPSTVKLNEIKANNIGPDGKYLSEQTYYQEFGTPVSGGGTATPGLDIINSIVYSWETTTRSRGAASRGRMYPPNFSLSHSTGTGRINTASRTTTLAQAKVFLSALRNAAGTIPAAPVLISTTDDRWSYINRCSIDDIIDVQRRRKNQLIGSRIQGVWP